MNPVRQYYRYFLFAALVSVFTVVFGPGESPLAYASSPTELACGHLPLATSTDPANTMAADVIVGPPVPYRPFELAGFPNVNWKSTKQDPTIFYATNVMSFGAAPSDTVRVPITQTKLPGGLLIAPKSVLVNACEYYNEINGVENYLNTLGESLRDNTTRYHAKGTVITPTDAAAFDSQKAANDAITDITPVGSGLAAEVRAEVEARYGELYGAAGQQQAQTYQTDALGIRNFNTNNAGMIGNQRLHSYNNAHNCGFREFGWPKTFYATLSCNFAINYYDPNATRYFDNGVAKAGNYPNQRGYATKVEGSAGATGAVFGLAFDILDTSIAARTYPDGSVDAKLSGKIMGFDIFSGSAGTMKRHSLKLADSNFKQVFNLEESVIAIVAVGPIPLTMEIGARGGGTIDYQYALAGLKADGIVKPQIFVEGFASVGVNLAIVGAKVEAALTILEDEIEAGGHVDVRQQGQNLGIVAMASIYNTFETLSGDINLVVWFYVPRWGWVPWVKKELEHTLFSWDGVRSRGSLYKADESFLLYQ